MFNFDQNFFDVDDLGSLCGKKLFILFSVFCCLMSFTHFWFLVALENSVGYFHQTSHWSNFEA